MKLQVPQEILDHILDFLYDDDWTLRSCALASRALLQTSRYHRFNGLNVPYPRIAQFDALLHLSPDIASSIKSLSLIITTSFRWSELAFLTHLPALADLTIGVAALHPVASHVPNLKILRIYGRRMLVSNEDLIYGVSKFRSLQELGLVEVRCLSDDPLAEYPSAPPLLKLHFEGRCCVPLICGWLAAVGSTPAFHSSSQTIREEYDAETFTESAEALAPLTQELVVKFMPEGNMNDAIANTDLTLAPFTALHSCTLRFAFGEMCVQQNMSLPWISTILGQLSSPYLRTLRISLAVDNVEDLRSLASECAVRVISPAYFDDMRVLDWEAIEKALVNDQLQGLEKVYLEGRGSREALQRHVEELCPLLHSRGILSLVPVEEAPWLD